MQENEAVAAFSALAHPLRVQAVRLLIRAGPEGLPAGRIAEALETPPSTLSSHLAQLQRTGLVRAERKQQRIFYAASLEGTRELIDFLVEDCCNGHPEVCGYAGTPADARGAELESQMSEELINVLFLCTGNSARSIIAECILNRTGRGKFRAYSAGSMPSGGVNPHALQLLENTNYDVSSLRPKSWDEFAAEGAPALDFVFTVCDNAANEVCPVWSGQPMTAHWGIPDPAVATGTDAEIAVAFGDTYRMLNNRIGIFCKLPLTSLDTPSLQKKLDEIGRTRDQTRSPAETA